MLFKNKTNKAAPELFQSPIAIAVGATAIVAAAFNPKSPATDSPPIIWQQFSLDSSDIAEAIGQWAKAEGLAFDFDTPFILNCTEYHERTALLALPDEVLRLEEEELTAYLIAASQNNTPGLNGEPLFGANADFIKTAFIHYRLPSGQVGLTSVTRRDLSLAAGRIVDYSTIENDAAELNAQPVVNLQIETPTRALARYYIDLFDSRNDSGLLTAFISVSPKGYAFGVISVAAGDLIFETAEPFEKQAESGAADFLAGAEELELNSFADDDGAERVSHALSEMQTEFRKMRFAPIETLVWVTTPEMKSAFEKVLTDQAETINMKPVALDQPFEKAVACGLLLSNAETSIPTVNLVGDLINQLTEEEARASNLQAAEEAKHRRLTAYALVLPVLLTLALALGLLADTIRSSRALTKREAAANEVTAQLEPTLTLWNSYIERYDVYLAYTKQVIALRSGQDRAISLFAELDGRYPLALGGGFFVSDLKLAPDGVLEMKGMARDEKAITAFVESLESSKTVKGQTYSKTFGSSLTFDLQQRTAAQSTVAGTSPPVAPGIVLWTIKGNYAPMTLKPAIFSAPATPNQANPALVPAGGLKPNQTIKSAPGEN